MIRSLRIKNAGPFRGEHLIELGPKVYALTARYESDAGRSNWGGKSFLLELVNFALTGTWPKERRAQWGNSADGWITRGEKDALVELVLEDGTEISRERRRGQSTQVRYAALGFMLKATQEEASVRILKHLGFDAEDFLNVAYLEQKKMARFVTTEPEKRLDVVRGWFGLGKAEAAEERAGELVSALLRELDAARARRDALASRAAPSVFDFAAKEAELLVAREELRATDKRVLDAFGEANALEKDRERVMAYDALAERGKALSAEVRALPTNLEEKSKIARGRWEDAQVTHLAAKREEEARRKVSLGLFDGKCPVAPIECPVKKKINDDREAGKKAHAAAHRAQLDALANVEAERKNAAAAEKAAFVAAEKRRELERLRAEVTPLVDAVKASRRRLKEAKSTGAGDGAAREAEEERYHASAKVERLRDQIAQARAEHVAHEKIRAEVEKLQADVDELAKRAAVAVRSRGVIRAAQRRVVEGALSEINRRAGAMLADAGVDLSVELRWEREGKGPAKQCEECGAAFPASAKVKECQSCGSPRGQLVVQRLEFLPSDRSGAADDVAGVALVLAAGAWFLSSRSSPWATAILDEPLGACDRTNRRALSLQLARLLSSGVWRQGIIISHNPDTVDLYPGRIEVVVARNGDRKLVVT